MSVAERPVHESVPLDQLDQLDYGALLIERADARMKLMNVIGQLDDSGRRPTGPEDDSEPWQAYRDWRRRARKAKTAINVRLEKIRLLLYCVQAERVHAKQLAEGKPPQTTAEDAQSRAEENARRRASLAETLADGGPDALLLRCRLLFVKTWSGLDLEDLPLDEHDRETLVLVSTYLNDAFGQSVVKRTLRDMRGLPPR